MVKWFDRTPRDMTRQLLRQHRVPVVGNRVLLSDLKPDAVPFVGQALALELELVAQSGRALEYAPDSSSRVALTSVVRIHSSRAVALAQILESEDASPAAAVAPFAESARSLAAASADADWYEQLLTVHLVGGMLTDFFVAASGGLPEETRGTMLRALRGESAESSVVALLRAAIAQTPRLSDRLAVWGRRLVGDALLQMYIAVNGSDDAGRAVPSQPRLEPAFNDIVASHTRRMDELGLSA